MKTIGLKKFAFFFVLHLVSAGHDHEDDTAVQKSPEQESRYRQPGYQSVENTRNRKIVQLLRQKGNGVNNYETAKLIADDFIDRKRKSNTRRARENEQQKKALGIFKKKNRIGYRTNEMRIQRSMKKNMKKDPNLNEIEARKLAEKELEKLRKYNAFKMRQSKALKMAASEAIEKKSKQRLITDKTRKRPKMKDFDKVL